MEKCTFDRGYDCVALKKRDCDGCPFHKTKEELLEGRRRARARREKLPAYQREAIEEKYYEKNDVRFEI